MSADFESFTYTLNNSGETITLYDNLGEVIDVVYIEGGSSDNPEPDGYSFPNLSAEPGNSIQIKFQSLDKSFTWDEAAPVPGDYPVCI